MKKIILSLILFPTICFGQIISSNKTDEIRGVMSSQSYQSVMSNLNSGLSPLAITFYNFGPGLIEFRHSDTNGIGYVVPSGVGFSIGDHIQMIKLWYARIIGATNTTYQIIRESR